MNAFHDKLQFSMHIFFFDLLKTVVKITQSMRVDNINFILCRQKWDFSWLFTIFRFDIKIDEYIRYDPKFRHFTQIIESVWCINVREK